MLSIGGAKLGLALSPPWLVSCDPNNRAAFIKSSITITRKYGFESFDGMDIDQEFPSNHAETCQTLFKEWQNYEEGCRHQMHRMEDSSSM
ncbi:hypothetical protein COLO4_18756 [Corchorus olitorius]|uniref:GH18 domain-containing protein n=1 Tax=Corchorus olitorius TaxID=93759 RepID=A0A1R3J7X4_9ROSI|nr:hypothetical protein COLO4_18756 [Corchorus olitorius]